MTTYFTTPNGFRYPSGAIGEAPDPAGDLQKLATDIDTYLGPTVGTATFPGTSSDASTIQLLRIGKLVVLSDYIGVGTNGMPAGGLILVVPTGFRPKIACSWEVPVYAAGGAFSGIRAVLELGTDGQLICRYTSATVPANSNVLISVSYPAA